jgi:hypothetical protein
MTTRKISTWSGGVEFLFGDVRVRLLLVSALDEDGATVRERVEMREGRSQLRCGGAPDAHEFTDVLLFVLPRGGRELEGWSFCGSLAGDAWRRHWIARSQVEEFEDVLNAVLKKYKVDIRVGAQCAGGT